MSGTLALALALLFVALNGFFVATEFAIVKVRRTRIDELVKGGSGRAKLALPLVDKLDEYLSATQLGITLASLALGWIGEPAFAHLITPPLSKLALSPEAIHTVAAAISFGLITFLHIVFGELAPKSVAILKAEGTTLAVALPMRAFYTAFYPFIWVLNMMARFALRLMGLKAPTEAELVHSPEELRMIVGSMRDTQEEPGVLDVVHRTLALPAKTAKDLMVARGDIESMRLDWSREEIVAKLRGTEKRRWPVIEEDIDHVAGILDAREYLLAPQPPHTPAELRAILRRPIYVPEVMTSEALFRELRSRGEELAIVVDEYGGTSGLVTVDDVVSAMFGDAPGEGPSTIAEHPSGAFTIDPKTPVTEVEEHFSVQIGKSEATTIGGVVMERLGRIPAVGDRVLLSGLTVTVETMDGPRIVKLSAKVPTSAPPPPKD